MKIILISLMICLSLIAEENTAAKASYNFRLSQPELMSISEKLKIAEAKLKDLNSEVVPSTVVEVQKKEESIAVEAVKETAPETVQNEVVAKIEMKAPAQNTESLLSEEELRRLKLENGKLREEIYDLKKNISTKENTGELKDRLSMAELEVERLSDLLNTKREDVLAGRKPRAPQVVVAAKAVENPLLSQKQIEKAEPDMQTLTVMAEKVFLRINPGKDASPLMAVTKGNKLVVEKRVGEWYRVIAPNGTRAWISSDVVAFGGTPNSAPTTTVKVAGYNSELEDEAFKTIMGISSNNK